MFDRVRRWLAKLSGETTAGEHADAVIVIGLLPSDSDADIALNNLAEADFAARNISVLTGDPRRTAALTDTPGEWGSLTPSLALDRMRMLGVADADCKAFGSGLAAGGVLIVIRTTRDAARAAEETLLDQKATLVRAVPERRGKR